MKIRRLGLALGLTLGMNASLGFSATIQYFKLPTDGALLAIQLSDGRSFDAPFTSAHQRGFGNVQISSDRRFIGWTATHPNCCTSYPLPRELVIHNGEGVVRIVSEESLSIFEWRFAPDGGSVIVRGELPHGASPLRFQQVRITDGKLLRTFDCEPMERGDTATRPPEWTGAKGIACAEPTPPVGAMRRTRGP